MIDVPSTWADGSPLSSVEVDDAPSEINAIKMLRIAGCKCELPLLGYRPGTGPRCRVCNTVALEDLITDPSAILKDNETWGLLLNENNENNAPEAIGRLMVRYGGDPDLMVLIKAWAILQRRRQDLIKAENVRDALNLSGEVSECIEWLHSELEIYRAEDYDRQQHD